MLNARRAVSALIWIIALAAIDQLSKYWVVHNLIEHEPYQLLPCLSLFSTRNYGIAFSMLSSFSDWGLIILTLIIIGFVLWLLARLERGRALARFSYLLILGGALGNLIDRLRLHYVVDFISFHLGSWHFAVFNPADAFITCGAIGIFLAEFLKIGDRK